MKDIDNIFLQIKDLSSQELNTLANKIFEILNSNNAYIEASADVSEISCRKCGCENVSKYGKDKNGKQRFKCKSCGALFVDTSFSVISNTHKDYDTWKKFIKLTLERRTLKYCADECKISERTAFIWRHKILSSLQRDQSNRVLSGVVETDDMFFSVSYKGNHKNSKRFTMPRKPYQRGNDNRAAIGNKACVLYAIERNGQCYGEVLGTGAVSVPMLSYAFKDRIGDDSIVVSDGAYNYKRYFDNTNIVLVQTAAHSIPRDYSSPPEIKGNFHLQNVNNSHKRFRDFLKPYIGVSTKYLNNYVSLFVWIENYKKTTFDPLENELEKRIFSAGSYIKTEDILSLPPVPNVA